MSTITKNHNTRARRHKIGANGRPLCGGGHGGRSAQYQEDMVDDVDCAACLKLAHKLPPPNSQKRKPQLQTAAPL